MSLSEAHVQELLDGIWSYYPKQARHDLPWRIPEPDGSFDPYKILVSELMLQQTQVRRVVPKYAAFLDRFPSFRTLAHAPLGDVLRVWQGLGYNRRAKYLWQAAQQLVALGAFPTTLAELVRLHGVGVNTAGAILAYAYDQPVLFIETNVRTVFLHHCFRGQQAVADSEIKQALEQTLAYMKEHQLDMSYREFYWALMDYGSYLKTVTKNNHQSKHYAKQSKFEGSSRALRGAVLRLLATSAASGEDLQTELTDTRLPDILMALEQEGLIRKVGDGYSL